MEDYKADDLGNQIDVDEIMSQIRQNMDMRKYGQEPLPFENISVSTAAEEGDVFFDRTAFSKEVDYLNYNWNNCFHISDEGKNSFIGIIKKLIRKSTFFIVFPIVNFQNAYNASNAKCMCQINACLNELESYKQKIDKLEDELRVLKGNK